MESIESIEYMYSIKRCYRERTRTRQPHQQGPLPPELGKREGVEAPRGVPFLNIYYY
jgi:hypothetical protein